MAPTAGPIMIKASQVRRHLQQLHAEIGASIEAKSLPDDVHADAGYLADCLGRFGIWAGSLGVFQKGDASLDARLSSHMISREVLRLLAQLDRIISDLQSIVDGKREQATWTKASLEVPLGELLGDDLSDAASWSEDSVDEPVTVDSDTGGNPGEIMTESRELHLSIGDSITSLLRLSIQVQASSKRAKFAKSSTEKNYDVQPDISHVRDFFPRLGETGNDELAVRLGKANAQRRQWLWYRRRHRDKLATDLSETDDKIPNLAETTRPPDHARTATGLDRRSLAESHPSGSWSPSLASSTRASTFRSRVTDGAESPSNAPPDTFFGRSSRATASQQRLVPEPPHDMVLGQPYQCRYCCNVIEISGKHAWQKHVHSDLSSYTCLATDCDELFFESRNRWWAHEMQVHRLTWRCGLCDSRHSSLSSMMAHIRESHGDLFRADQVKDIAQRFGRPVGSFHASECPLCDYESILRGRGVPEEEIQKVPVDKFWRHLGRHLEQLALFVLPSTDLVDEDDGQTDDGNEREGDEHSDSDDGVPGQVEDEDYELDWARRLADVVALEKSALVAAPLDPPILGMRWQPPQDFTPPLRDFDVDDVDKLPTRQEPLYGGDLHTSGWARGFGDDKEAFCARCPVPHWLSLPNGSYRFHMTYFHGVPGTGVPLPRPTEIRPVRYRDGEWEGFCNACDEWKTLKKTRRGWNWYRHWLKDHGDIVKQREEAVRSGTNPEEIQPQSQKSSANSKAMWTLTSAQLVEVAKDLEREPDILLQDDPVHAVSELAQLTARGMFEAVRKTLEWLSILDVEDEVRSLVNTHTDKGDTLLMVSAYEGLVDLVNLLLKLGADPNAADERHEQTALDLAADAGHFSVAQSLIEAGADASRAHIFRRILSNEHEYAGESVKDAIAEQAAQGTALHTKFKPRGPLGRAALAGDLAAVTELLGDGTGPSRCDVEEGAEIGCSPFLLASTNSHFDVMSLLLNRGADINTTSKHGWTPLMLASQRGDLECVEYLLENHANVNHLSPDRWTALAEATNNGGTDIMEMLLFEGADADIRAQSDWTPLMHAAYRGDLGAVDMLLDFGASVDEMSARDVTPMLAAAASGSAAVVKRLLVGACPPDPLWARLEGSVGVPRTETPRTAGTGSKVQERMERAFKIGWTPLMVAAQLGSLEIVEMLLDAGANPHSKSPMFKTALEIARENGRTDVVAYLEELFGKRGE